MEFRWAWSSPAYNPLTPGGGKMRDPGNNVARHTGFPDAGTTVTSTSATLVKGRGGHECLHCEVIYN